MFVLILDVDAAILALGLCLSCLNLPQFERSHTPPIKLYTYSVVPRTSARCQ